MANFARIFTVVAVVLIKRCDSVPPPEMLTIQMRFVHWDPYEIIPDPAGPVSMDDYDSADEGIRLNLRPEGADPTAAATASVQVYNLCRIINNTYTGDIRTIPMQFGNDLTGRTEDRFAGLCYDAEDKIAYCISRAPSNQTRGKPAGFYLLKWRIVEKTPMTGADQRERNVCVPYQLHKLTFSQYARREGK